MGSLCNLIRELVEHVQRPIQDGFGVIVGEGSQDLLAKLAQVLAGPGDVVVVEDPTYYTGLDIIRYTGARMLTVPQDSLGVDVDALEELLEHQRSSNGPMPKFFYTVTHGSNPSGITVSLDRREKVLALARRYNFLVLEDDPYWCIEFSRGDTEKLLPSYFALDKDSRVIRVESFSKSIAPGLRVGFAVAPELYLDHINWITSKSNLQPSAMSQLVVRSILEDMKRDNWSGLDKRVAELRSTYRKRCEAMIGALEKHFGSDSNLLRWQKPAGGMFVWMRIVPELSKEALIGGCLQGALSVCLSGSN